VPVRKTHDYIHHYRGYWSEGGKCRIRIYQEDGCAPVVICSQLPDNRQAPNPFSGSEGTSRKAFSGRLSQVPLPNPRVYPRPRGQLDHGTGVSGVNRPRLGARTARECPARVPRVRGHGQSSVVPFALLPVRTSTICRQELSATLANPRFTATRSASSHRGTRLAARPALGQHP
jgi:hypothetical protein